MQPQDLAEKLVGSRHRAMMQRVERARIALHAARDGDRALRTGRTDAFGKISRGLAARKLGEAAA